MDKEWMPTVAGVLDIVAGVAALVGMIFLLFAATLVGHLAARQGGEFPLPMVAGLLIALTALVALLGILAVWGGASLLRRRSWGWGLTGGIAATLTFPPAGIVALVLTVLSEPLLRPPPQS